MEASDDTESVEFWRVALVRSLKEEVSKCISISPNIISNLALDKMLNLLNRTVLNNTLVTSTTSLDGELDALVVTEGAGNGSGSSVRRHCEFAVEKLARSGCK